MRFPTLIGALCKLWILFQFSLVVLFPGSSSFLTFMHWSILSWRLTKDSRSPEISLPLSAQLFPLTASLASPDSLLHLLNSGRPLGSSLFFVAWEIGRQWAGAIIGLIPFVHIVKGITTLHCLMFNVLKTIVSYTLFSISLFGQESKSCPSGFVLHLD